MAEINLLPNTLGQKTRLLKIVRSVRIINQVGTAIFCLSMVVVVVWLSVNSMTATNLSAKVEALKTEVKSRQQQEKQYFLLQNRLESIKKHYLAADFFAEVKDFSTFYMQLKPLAETSAVAVAPGKVETMVTFRNSSDLKSFFEKIISSDYERIVLDSLSFRSGGGYQAQVVFYLHDKE